MKNIMIDIETMGNKPNSAIISIGAVYFDETGIGREFYHKVSLQSSVNIGLEMDPETVLWWLRQPDAARAEFSERGEPLYHVLKLLKDFIHTDCQIWGNGSTFDNVILESAYRKSNTKAPWEYYNSRCFRTLKNLFPHIQLEKNIDKHNALSDAIWQAKYASKVLRFIKSSKKFCI